jgi:type IV pilus assembly protein PilB
VGDLLVAEGTISRDQLGRAMAHRAGVEFHTLADGVDPAVAQLIDERNARRYSAVPVWREPDGTIVVAMADPANVFAVDDIRILLKSEVRAVLAMPDDIRELLTHAGAMEDMVADIIEETGDEDVLGRADPTVTDISMTMDDAPVVRLVNSIISRAVDERASDIHFEPQGGEMVVRYRVDGVLRQVTSVPRRMAGGLASRIKIMADLDIAEKRVPQDGRIGLNVGGRSLDMRVASLPTVYGEKVVMRVLDKSNVLLKMSELGFTADTLGRFESCYRRPYGAVLVTGPTGSGKSTTLYAALNQVNSKEKNIITVEDPVEYRLAGVNQVQVNTKAGLTFAAGLRSILRCDPDIVMIGEIRDRETAKIAVESALTGHLVLATIHTNDSAGGLTRLAEMGVEPFLSASAVVDPGPAAGPAAVPPLPRADDHPACGAARDGGRSEPAEEPARPRAGLPAQGLPALLGERLPGEAGRVRGPHDERGDRAAHRGRRVLRGDPPPGPARGHACHARGRPSQGSRRPHDAGGARPRRRLTCREFRTRSPPRRDRPPSDRFSWSRVLPLFGGSSGDRGRDVAAYVAR